MTREKARQLQPVIQAFVEGMAIQFRYGPTEHWVDCGDESFNSMGSTEYRIKPEPKCRPWKCAEEVPLPCIVTNGSGARWMVLYAGPGGIRTINCDGVDEYTYAFVFASFKYSTDGCKTWKKCGVEE